MKLSFERRLGFIHVRPGKLLTVVHQHQVTTISQSVSESSEHRRVFGANEKWVTTNIGDLAVEIVAVKPDKVIGYSYLSGPAVRLHLYREAAPSHWFAPAKVLRIDTRSLPAAVSTTPIMGVIEAAMRVKYGDHQLVCFEIQVESAESIQECMQLFAKLFGFSPDDGKAHDCAHIVGRVSVHKKKAPFGAFHYQPPKDASAHTISAWQNELVIRGDWEVTDPWTPLLEAAG